MHGLINTNMKLLMLHGLEFGGGKEGCKNDVFRVYIPNAKNLTWKCTVFSLDYLNCVIRNKIKQFLVRLITFLCHNNLLFFKTITIPIYPID